MMHYFLVASAGGGKVGGEVLSAVARAFAYMPEDSRLQVFTGPFMDDGSFSQLKAFESPTIRVDRFTSDFLSFLDAADLSVSMAGYNTSMNIMAARTPALVWPFAQNREQRLRAERLARLGGSADTFGQRPGPATTGRFDDRVADSKRTTCGCHRFEWCREHRCLGSRDMIHGYYVVSRKQLTVYCSWFIV